MWHSGRRILPALCLHCNHSTKTTSADPYPKYPSYGTRSSLGPFKTYLPPRAYLKPSHQFKFLQPRPVASGWTGTGTQSPTQSSLSLVSTLQSSLPQSTALCHVEIQHTQSALHLPPSTTHPFRLPKSLPPSSSIVLLFAFRPVPPSSTSPMSSNR